MGFDAETWFLLGSGEQSAGPHFARRRRAPGAGGRKPDRQTFGGSAPRKTEKGLMSWLIDWGCGFGFKMSCRSATSDSHEE